MSLQEQTMLKHRWGLAAQQTMPKHRSGLAARPHSFGERQHAQDR